MNNEIMKIARSMKRQIVHINNHFMLGTDEDFFTLSVIETESIILRPFTTTINGYLDESKKEKFANDNPQIFLTEYIRLDTDLYINSWNEYDLNNKILYMYNSILHTISSCPIGYTESGLEQNKEFMSTVAKLKVDDGMTRYILGGRYLITSFNKVHAINSTDKVSVNVYDIDLRSFICEFIVDKKKYVIREYIRYRKIPNYN